MRDKTQIRPFSSQTAGMIAKWHFHTSTQTLINSTGKDILFFFFNQITTKKLSHELEACLTAKLISMRPAWTLSQSLSVFLHLCASETSCFTRVSSLELAQSEGRLWLKENLAPPSCWLYTFPGAVSLSTLMIFSQQVREGKDKPGHCRIQGTESVNIIGTLSVRGSLRNWQVRDL